MLRGLTWASDDIVMEPAIFRGDVASYSVRIPESVFGGESSVTLRADLTYFDDTRVNVSSGFQMGTRTGNTQPATITVSKNMLGFGSLTASSTDAEKETTQYQFQFSTISET